MSRQAREPSILLLVVQKILVAVVEVIFFILMKFPKFWTGFGAEDDFRGVALVESIDKRLIFGLVTMSNR